MTKRKPRNLRNAGAGILHGRACAQEERAGGKIELLFSGVNDMAKPGAFIWECREGMIFQKGRRSFTVVLNLRRLQQRRVYQEVRTVFTASFS